jgi:hypothetical protein
MALDPTTEFVLKLKVAWARGKQDGKRRQKFTPPFDKTEEIQEAYACGYHRGEIESLPEIAEAA